MATHSVIIWCISNSGHMQYAISAMTLIICNLSTGSESFGVLVDILYNTGFSGDIFYLLYSYNISSFYSMVRHLILAIRLLQFLPKNWFIVVVVVILAFIIVVGVTCQPCCSRRLVVDYFHWQAFLLMSLPSTNKSFLFGWFICFLIQLIVIIVIVSFAFILSLPYCHNWYSWTGLMYSLQWFKVHTDWSYRCINYVESILQY